MKSQFFHTPLVQIRVRTLAAVQIYTTQPDTHLTHNLTTDTMAKTTPARRKPPYNPPATATPKAVCLLLVRPDGNIVVIQGQNSTWDDVGGRLLDNENIASGAARVVTKETGLTLQQLSAELIGSVYQRFSRAQVLVYKIQDVKDSKLQWRDPSTLTRHGKGHVWPDGAKPSFRLDMNLKLAGAMVYRAHRSNDEPLFAGAAQ